MQPVTFPIRVGRVLQADHWDGARAVRQGPHRRPGRCHPRGLPQRKSLRRQSQKEI